MIEMEYSTERNKVVMARDFSCWNIPIWNNVLGVKIDFDCGKCGFSQSKRVPIRDYPVVECKHCKTLNRINIVATTYGSD
jgi:hypothetical protein